jgi:hypothetical protein
MLAIASWHSRQGSAVETVIQEVAYAALAGNVTGHCPVDSLCHHHHHHGQPVCNKTIQFFLLLVTRGSGILLAGHTRFCQVNPTARSLRHCLTSKTRQPVCNKTIQLLLQASLGQNTQFAACTVQLIRNLMQTPSLGCLNFWV